MTELVVYTLGFSIGACLWLTYMVLLEGEDE